MRKLVGAESENLLEVREGAEERAVGLGSSRSEQIGAPKEQRAQPAQVILDIRRGLERQRQHRDQPTHVLIGNGARQELDCVFEI